MEKIKLDLVPSGKMPSLHASQYDDGREHGIDLFENGVAYKLDGTETLTINERKGDDCICSLDIENTFADTNHIVFASTEQMCAVWGNNICELVIAKGEKTIGTLNFILEIEQSPTEGGIESESEIKNLERQIEAITEEVIGDNYYTAEETDDAIETATEGKADKTYVDTELDKKADKSSTYTKTEVDTLIDNLPEPMIFKGTLGVGGTIQSLPTASASNEGFTYKVITDGTYAGQTAKVGDVFTSNGSAWVLIPSGDEDNDTWRAIKVEGVEVLGNGISSGAVDFVGSENIEVDFDGNGNKVGVKTKNIYTKEEVDDIIYNILPTKSASGAVANFNTSLALPLKSLIADINPIQEGTGDPSPDNIRPISGWNKIRRVHCGTNLWNEEWELGSIDTTTGNPTSASSGIRSRNFIPVLPNTTYFFTTPVSGLIYEYDKEQNYIRCQLGGSVLSAYTFTTSANTHYLKLRTASTYGRTYNNDMGINYPSTDLEYHAYNGTTTPYTLPQTVYGGKIVKNKTGGVLRITHKQIVISSATSGVWRWYDNYKQAYIDNLISDYPAVSYPNEVRLLCDKFKPIEVNNRGGNVGNFVCIISSGNGLAFGSEYDTLEDFRVWLANNPITVVYELATPIEIPLSDLPEIVTKQGVNNIWVDSGDIAVDYKCSVEDYVSNSNSRNLLGGVFLGSNSTPDESEGGE